jgi:predicted tellurium resistance membrane protein TerC
MFLQQAVAAVLGFIGSKMVLDFFGKLFLLHMMWLLVTFSSSQDVVNSMNSFC